MAGRAAVAREAAAVKAALEEVVVSSWGRPEVRVVARAAQWAAVASAGTAYSLHSSRGNTDR